MRHRCSCARLRPRLPRGRLRRRRQGLSNKDIRDDRADEDAEHGDGGPERAGDGEWDERDGARVAGEHVAWECDGWGVEEGEGKMWTVEKTQKRFTQQRYNRNSDEHLLSLPQVSRVTLQTSIFVIFPSEYYYSSRYF